MRYDAFLIENWTELSSKNELGMGFHFCIVQEQINSEFSQKVLPGTHLIVFNQTIGLTFQAYYDLIREGDHIKRFLLEFCEIFENIDREKDSFIFSKGLSRVVVDIEQDKNIYDFFCSNYWPFNKRYEKKLHSSPSFNGKTAAVDRFYRFSAFRNDRRIIHGGGLYAGTYATSFSDYGEVPNALHAVGRYALPNPVPPVHVFEIVPPENTSILYGTVAPQHNQSGGGAEIEFQDNLPAGSVVYIGTKHIW